MRTAQGHLEIRMESALTPREIQARIRSGESIEDVARAAGVPVEQVEPFATPVIAERDHQARMALASPVRRRGETGSNRHLEAVVAERLLSRGIDIDSVVWDAWRAEDRTWTVQGRFESGSAPHEALFHFDPKTRFSTAANDEASWLISETSPAHGPQPGRRSPHVEDAEPTVDLRDASALLRASIDAAEMTTPLPHSTKTTSKPAQSVESSDAGAAEASEVPDDDAAPSQAAPIVVEYVEVSEVTQLVVVADAASEPVAEPIQDAIEYDDSIEHDDSADGARDADHFGDDYVDTELEQVDGVYDFVPAQQTNPDMLYDMLASLNEDSVNIYAGLSEPPTPIASVDDQADEPTAPAAQDVEASKAETDAFDTHEESVADQSELDDPEPKDAEPQDAEPKDAEPEDAEPEDAEPEDAEPEDAEKPEPTALIERPVVAPVDTPASHAEAPKPKPAPRARRQPATSKAAPTDAAEQAPLVGEATPKPKPRTRKRASVPSWDEIMFGGPKPN